MLHRSAWTQEKLYTRRRSVLVFHVAGEGGGCVSSWVPQGIFVGGEWVKGGTELPVTAPATGEVVGMTWAAGPSEYEAAVAHAVACRPVLRAQAAYERSAILRRVEAGVLDRLEDIAQVLCMEAGKPIKDARTEVRRSAFAFRVAAEEAERIYGEVIPLDLNDVSRGRTGITRRFPIGPVAGVSPFNLPMSLAVHKVAPAMAAGCPIVLKPPSAAPLTMLMVAEVIAEAGAPPGSVSVVPMSRDVGGQMVADDRFTLLSFTGSAEVGWDLKARAGKKKVVLELGGNAAAVLDETGDLDRAVERCTYGAFKYAGQLCISVQRVLVHERRWDTFVERLVARARQLRVGDPLDPSNDLGPMIDGNAVARIREWVDEAVQKGAKVLLGGEANGNYFQPTVLTDVPKDARIWADEAFAPVVCLAPFRRFEDALATVNDSAFGLQTGIFSNDISHVWGAFGALEVGGVVANDAPTYRIDHMPYGGVKDSGLGREGIRWSIEDMTELRILVLPTSGAFQAPGASSREEGK